MRRPWLDWVFMGVVVIAIVLFFSLISKQSIAGNVVGGGLALPDDCVTYSTLQPYTLSSSLRFCPAATHRVEYFDLVESDLVIDCLGSTIRGNGGALFVAQTEQPTVTLRDCVIEGYGGLYSSQNPVTVRVESRE